MRRVIDILFIIYFVSHIGFTVLFDSQVFLPASLYPDILKDFLHNFCISVKDPLLLQLPLWYKSFMLCEMFLQFPFFIVATYAYWKGPRRCKWIRLPMIMYTTHTATTLIPILYHIFYYDFQSPEARKLKYPGPSTLSERFRLASVYLPYFVIPLFMLTDALFSAAYRIESNMDRKTTESPRKTD